MPGRVHGLLPSAVPKKWRDRDTWAFLGQFLSPKTYNSSSMVVAAEEVRDI